MEYDFRYLTDLKELVGIQPELEEEINKCIMWFKNKPEDARLDNHELTKRMKGKWSFSVTGDIRVVYKRLGRNEVRFLAIGGHKKVYSVAKE